MKMVERAGRVRGVSDYGPRLMARCDGAVDRVRPCPSIVSGAYRSNGSFATYGMVELRGDSL